MKIHKTYYINDDCHNVIHFKRLFNNFVKIYSEQKTRDGIWRIMWEGVGLFHNNRYYGIFKHPEIKNEWFNDKIRRKHLSNIIGLHFGTPINDNLLQMTGININGFLNFFTFTLYKKHI